MKKVRSYSLIFLLLIFGKLIFSQNQLSNNYQNPNLLFVNYNCESVEFEYSSESANDLEIPVCYRNYPGKSSYFKFVVPEEGWATIKVSFAEENIFGLAIYSFEEGEYVEIKCDIFKSTEGYLRIRPTDELAGKEILGRYWNISNPNGGILNLCVFSEPISGYEKVISISTTQYNVNQLVQDVLVTGCLTANNIQYTGHNNAIGYFYNGIPPLNFADGVILSTGNISTAPGPNNTGSAGTNLGRPGNSLLNSIANGTTYDAAVLSFNFVPASNMLEFQYVFASEEYPEYAGSSYNDVFAFFLSGGPENYNNVNIALIPGTSTPVTINNVNHYTNSQYYVNNSGNAHIQYDGMTVTLTAQKPVTPCATYNIKLAIADVGDGVYDSAVFLKSNSFSSGDDNNFTAEGFNSWSPSLPVMRGCPGYIVFTRNPDVPLNQTVTITYTVSGTAIPGTDYTPIPTTVTIPAGQPSTTIYFNTFDLGYPTGDRTIILSFTTGCPCDQQSIQHVITITDAFVINPVLTNNSPVCSGSPATLTLNLNTPQPQHVQINWSTGQTNITSIQVNPTETTTYSVQVIYPCDTITLYTTVQVGSIPTAQITSQSNPHCGHSDGSATVTPSGGTAPYTYQWSTTPTQTTATAQNIPSGTYQVTITDNLGCTTTANTTLTDIGFISASATGTDIECFGASTGTATATVTGGSPNYTFNWSNGYNQTTSSNSSTATGLAAGTVSVTVTDNFGCTSSATVLLNQNPMLTPSASNNGPACPGSSVQLSTQTYSTYAWSGPGGFSSSLQYPTISQISQGGVYNVTITDQYGCTATASTVVEVLPSPEATISGNQIYCQGENIQLTAATGAVSYQWSGPGGYTASGSSISRPNSNPSMSGTYFLTVTAANGCTNTGNYQITVYPSVNATISPVGNLCATDPVVLLNAVTPGGTWSGPGVSGNSFNPQVAGVGTHTISYTISNPACSDSDTEIVNVYNPIQVMNFNDQECNDTYTAYTVSFDVVDHLGNPTAFLANSGNGFQPYNSNFSLTIPSQTPYSITVVDPNFACSEFIFQGMRNCGCLTYAGTMTSLVPVKLCYGECSDMVNHNNNQTLDADDTFGFVLHTGGYPPNIIAYNSTPEFCYHLIPSLNFGQTYYISAVAGNQISPGIPDLSDPCFSISQGTPVIWYDIPVAHINSPDFSVCGLEACFSAQPALSGAFGYWTSPEFFITTQGTSAYSPDVCVMASNYQEIPFVWNVNNGNCIAKDTIRVNFKPNPTAYAGENFTNCGYTAELNAVFSLPSSTGEWTGPGLFSNQYSNSTSVTITPPAGPRTFTWREINGDCWDDHQITVNFVQPPNPIVLISSDSVCGNTYNLNVMNVQGSGQWNAYVNGEQPSFNIYYSNGQNSPQTQVSVANYDGHYAPVEFVWTEIMQVAGIQCSGSVSQNIIFSKMPFASVGADDVAEICGNCIQLNADMTGSEWAQGTWIPLNIIGSFTQNDANSPQATYCINEYGSYGDTAYVRIPFIWALRNYACMSVDTLTAYFYKAPNANAGIDGSICGNFYTLGAVFSVQETGSYEPFGIWSVAQAPIPGASANISPQNGDTVSVTVSHYGTWRFIFRENNSNLHSCYSTDTVTINFYEIPIIDAGPDKHVCGTTTTLEGISSGFPGQWAPNGVLFNDYNSPTTEVTTNTYGTISFVWIESNVYCSAIDTVNITFWRKPNANILIDEADSVVCGHTFPRLRAELPSTGTAGYWTTYSPSAFFDNQWSNFTSVTVRSYGDHYFYWIVENGPEDMPGFCADTAGPIKIRFIEIPKANAGNDTLFCGFSGTLNAVPSIGTGVWSTPSTQNISFDNPNSPNAVISSNIINAGNPTNPYFIIIWTEDNTNGCADSDTVNVTFARIPSSETIIIPPKCFGEEATIRAVEDSLQQYTWNFFNGLIVESFTNNQGGNHRNFVRWNDGRDYHVFSLISTNYWGCNSPIAIDTVYEPEIPNFNVALVKDTCALSKGGIIFNEDSSTTAFFWINDTIGPDPGPITQVLNIPAGEYGIRTSYLTPNTQYISHYLSTFGTQYCIDTFYYTIPTVGMIDAIMQVDASIDLENLVAPEALVVFLNNSIYDDVRKRCEWHFGDGTILKNCDPMVEHTYTKSGCYEPFLIVMNRDLPECRDTARLSACIQVDDESMIEVPNVFSPNGDGINDFFQVKAKTLKTFHGQIINRWGQIVFEWNNWQDYEAGWDGNNTGGTKAAPGVYYYIIKATGWDDKEYNLSGAFHLMR